MILGSHFTRFLSIFLVLAVCLICGLPQASIQRGMPIGTQEVPLAINGLGLPSSVGPADRDADHATLAMNSDLDIAVAFHTSRPDITGNGNMKQVEVAYYEYQAGDTWTHVDTVLVGSIDYHPVPFLPQQTVKCERPDIIAVGSRFFVTWTRRYDKSFAGQDHEPAVLECAWIEKGVGPSVQVNGDPGGLPGQGFILAAHVPGGSPSQQFEILECAGVPDAVVLKDSSLPAGSVKVGVAYPHQKVFSNPPNLDRQFTMRLATCTLDTTSGTISSSPPVDIQPTVLFNGPSASGGNTSAGLILPDLAPSAEENAFWLIAEAQTMTTSATPLPNGRIRLEYWQQVVGVWTLQAGKTFKSPPGGTPYVRRRPNVSSYPAASTPGGVQTVTLAFNKINPDPNASDKSANVVLAEWQYLNGNGSIPPAAASPWPNTSLMSDGKPVPLRGGDSPKIRRCFADRSPFVNPLPSSIVDFDAVGAVLTTLETLIQPGVPLPPGNVGRPAASYQKDPGALKPDYIAVAFEKKILAADPLRIWLGVE